MRIVKKKIFEDFIIQIRENNVMLSAPHSVKQIRENNIKKSESKTKYIVDKVAKKTKNSCIYKTKCIRDDANYDEISNYKKECSSVIANNNIQFLLDIHGMSALREEDICIGIANGKNINDRKDILEHIIKVLQECGFSNVSVDIPFSASRQTSVSSTINRKCHIIAFQIEINYKYISTKFLEYNLERVVNALCLIVKYLNECIE